MFSILAQDVTGYPTLKFFKSGADSSVKHRGGRDIDSLVAFIDEQMGRAPAKKEVRIMCTDYNQTILYHFLNSIFVAISKLCIDFTGLST